MKLGEICRNLEVISFKADPETEISTICYDSRKAVPGCLFVAIKGTGTDGNIFVPAAAEKGCAAVLCSSKPEIEVPYVLVEDCRRAMALASCAFFDYPADKMKIIGVTGTSGKTTVTRLIKQVMESTGRMKLGLIGTNGNLIGSRELHTEFTTPESFELQGLFKSMAEEGCSAAVMEVSSHSLFMERVAGISFSTAAFTNLSQDHLDLHGTMEAYAAEKKKLFSMCEKCCINADDQMGEYMAEGAACPVLRFSAKDSDADLYAKDISLAAGGVEFTAVYGGQSERVSLAIPGAFSVSNALTVVAVCLSEGLSLKECAEGLSSAEPVKGRLERINTGEDFSVIIDYSHKPDALEKVLKTLRPVTAGKLICLFGCGGDRDRAKRPIMGRIALENSDMVIVTSDNPRTEEPRAIIEEILAGMKGDSFLVVEDRIQAIHTAIDIARPGDVILLAGKGHEDYQIIGHTKIHMDEREIVSSALEERKHDY